MYCTVRRRNVSLMPAEQKYLARCVQSVVYMALLRHGSVCVTQTPETLPQWHFQCTSDYVAVFTNRACHSLGSKRTVFYDHHLTRSYIYVYFVVYARRVNLARNGPYLCPLSFLADGVLPAFCCRRVALSRFQHIEAVALFEEVLSSVTEQKRTEIMRGRWAETGWTANGDFFPLQYALSARFNFFVFGTNVNMRLLWMLDFEVEVKIDFALETDIGIDREVEITRTERRGSSMQKRSLTCFVETPGPYA